jgi:hypothetical protein
MNRNALRAATVLGAAALLIPSAAIARGKPADKPVKPAHGKSKPASYVFKGVWHADGTVTVDGGNARVRKNDLVGTVVGFDLTSAKLRAADTNADSAVTVADLVEGDRVVVKARLPRTEPGTGPFAARMLVDQTHPAVEEAEEDAAPEVEQA